MRFNHEHNRGKDRATALVRSSNGNVRCRPDGSAGAQPDRFSKALGTTNTSAANNRATSLVGSANGNVRCRPDGSPGAQPDHSEKHWENFGDSSGAKTSVGPIVARAVRCNSFTILNMRGSQQITEYEDKNT
jgi:hypothetical protein